MKKLLLAFIFLFSLTAHAQDNTDRTLERAYIGQGADIGTTAIGILSGAGYEANPLGFPGVIAVKAVALQLINKEAEPARTRDLTIFESFGWGAAANNALAMLSVAAGPAIAIGVGVGALVYKNRQPERDEANQWANEQYRRSLWQQACDASRPGHPDLDCTYGGS